MKWYDNTFWIPFGHFVNILNVLALIPVAIIIDRVRRQMRLNRLRKAPLPKTPNDRVGVLIINMSNLNIEGEVVELMRQKHPEIKLVKDKSEFYQELYHEFGGTLQPSDIGKVHELLGGYLDELYRNSIRHVHLFIFGPQILSLMLGKEFTHIGITYYSKDPKTHEYVCWGER